MLNPHPASTAVMQEAESWQAPPLAAGKSATQHRIDSRSLLQGGRELLIAHAGEDYHLRLTRNDKLILTK